MAWISAKLDWKTLAVVAVAAIALAVFFSYFIFEGFQIGSDPQARCKAHTSCGDCVRDTTCGWCPTAKKCVLKAGGRPVVPNDPTTKAPEFKCPMEEFVQRLDQCSDFTCGSLTNCADCSSMNKCGWCGDSQKCLEKTSNNTPVNPQNLTCGLATFVVSPEKCPATDCGELKDCKTCAGTKPCGWCPKEKKCVTEVRWGDASAATCKANEFVIFPSLCDAKPLDEKGDITVGSNEVQKRFEDALEGRTDMTRPEAGLTYTAPDGGADLQTQIGGLDQIPGGLTTPGQYSRGGPSGTGTTDAGPVVTAPGIVTGGTGGVRPLRQFGTGAISPTGLGPFEEYIQVLVRSELASQGIPTNEPFTVREEQALPNAGRYLESSMKGLLGSK
jgi:hypothetical protein